MHKDAFAIQKGLRWACFATLLLPARFEQEIAIDDHANGIAWTIRRCRLNVEITTNHLLPILLQRIRRAQPERLNNIRIAAGICSRAKLRSDAKDSREKCDPEQLSPVIVDLILETRISARIGSLLPFEHDRATVGDEQSIHPS